MKLSIDEALKKGVELHKAGQIQEADRFYTAVLQAQPKHPDANHNMGVLALGVGKPQDALPFFKTALEANQSITQYWVSYIDALIKLEKISDARAIFAQAKINGAKCEAFDQLEHRLSALVQTKNKAGAMKNNASNSSRPNILDNIKLDKALKLAKQKSKDGLISEAKSIYEDILKKHPQNKKTLSGLKSLKQDGLGMPKDLLESQLQPLINLYSQRQFQQTLSQANEMLQQYPSSVALYNILGATNDRLGKFGAAVDCYKQALKIKPDYAEALYNMGAALNSMGNSEAAIDSYKQALKIKPDFAEAYNNIGVAFNDMGNSEAAIDSCEQALKIKLDYAEAHNNIGLAYMNMGNSEAAIESYKQALKIRSDFAGAYINMGIVLNGRVFSEPEPDLEEIIVSLLNRKNFVRPIDISKAGISLVKFEPVIKELFEKHSTGDLNCSFEKLASSLQNVPLLLRLMSVCPLPDLEFEAVFTAIRSKLLSSISEITDSPEILVFQSALALQCFVNEYIYNQTSEEAKLLARLELSINSEISSGKQPSPHSILCLASYKALYNYEWGNLISVTADIEDVFTQQILEPKQESYLKSEMPILAEITERISSKVRKQYEKNPYPRWVNLGFPLNPKAISKIVNELNLRTFDSRVYEVESPAILIAGCGTGQHSIMTAARFLNSRVLAVDLSLSSLSYAKRKTEELGLQNIEYMQADILDLGKLEKKFEIVESSGVLHHMNDPIAGWKILAGCLKFGGLMKVGLYSEFARKHIIALRDDISQNNIGSDDDAMKSFRRDIINLDDKKKYERIQSSHDFYSLSAMRDLLFHVQEHRFTLPQIQDCLSQLGLEFCGFEADKIVQDFKRTNIGPDDPYDLDKWNFYEEANPQKFAGMYEFWCQKVA